MIEIHTFLQDVLVSDLLLLLFKSKEAFKESLPSISGLVFLSAYLLKGNNA